ncbi:MAG: tyrosine-type recombinase/integrase, partial [Candidatus Bathyarchaeia archaeon]
SRVKPEALLSIEDVKAMINAAENERDRALISVLFEAALRPSELLTMRVGSVEFKDKYCLISVCGKTGVKRIPLVASHRPLLDWLMKHPRRHDPDAPLWISLSNNSKSESMSYYYFRKLVKEMAEKAGLRRDVWPYLFRHSCLTALAKVLTESKLELYAGWVHGSRMARRYVHFSARDLEDAVLEIHGLREAKRSDGILKLA